MTIDTHGLKIGFGRHKGDLYTRVPCSYLTWMVNRSTQEHKIARAELDRRGYVDNPPLEVSGHAIDSASTRCLKSWNATKKRSGKNAEGLHAWLMRISKEALQAITTDDEGRYIHLNSKMCLIFQDDGVWPVLKTCYMAKGKQINQAKEKK